MSKSKALQVVGITSLLAAVVVAVPAPALAWNPKGTIVKKVQNTTTNSTLSDANEAAQAISAKPGDILKYVIEVTNDAGEAADGSNDMAATKLTDALPDGVELVAEPSKRTIQEDLGTLKPKQKVAKEYTVKVTSTQNGALIDNKACFTGNSGNNDSPQQGCDTAKVKVAVPEQPKPEQPKPESPKPEQPKTETPVSGASEDLPQTGPGALAAVIGTSVTGYAAHAYLRSRKGLRTIFRNKN